MSEHLVDARRRARRSTPRQRPLFEEGMAAEHRKTYRERNEKAILRDRPPRRAARPGRGLPRPQARPRADGLLRPDRARRPAGRRAARGRARSSASKFRVVLLDEYQDTSVAQALMLRRLFSGPDAEHGRGHPSPRSATPTRRSTAGAAPRSPTSSTSPTTSRAPTARRRADVPADGQPALRRADPRGRQPLAAPLYAQRRAGRARSSAEPDAGRRRRSRRAVLRDVRRRARPGWPTQVVARPRGDGRRRVARDRRADPRQRARRRRLRRADRAPRSRSRSSASRACSGCPRSPRSSPPCTLLHDVTANAALLTLLTGPRWAIGPRDLRAARPPGRASSPAAGAARATRADRRRPARRGRRRRRPRRDRRR